MLLFIMEWINKISRIVLLNLPSREDRLIQSAELFEQYSIPYERVSAIPNERGAVGLRDTVVNLFRDCLEKELKNVLVFEDDFSMEEGVESFHDTMDRVMEQLPENYHICYLGAQCTAGFTQFSSPNLLPVQKAFATHAWLISQQGMREILASDLQGPIDNHIVDLIQPMGHCYVTYPLLCSQRPGFSDIGREVFDWSPFIAPRYHQKLAEMRARK